MFFVILGAPGSGKGTRSDILKEKLKIAHISTGSMIRENKSVYEKYKDKIDNGHLLSDDIINEMLEERLRQNDIQNGCILDGYPRTIEQAYNLDKILERVGKGIDKVFLLDADIDTIYSRILSRVVCPKCLKIYNKKYAEENNNKCLECGSELVVRTDDNSDTLKNRIDVYYKNIDKIKEYYQNRGLLEIIDALEDPHKILERM